MGEQSVSQLETNGAAERGAKAKFKDIIARGDPYASFIIGSALDAEIAAGDLTEDSPITQVTTAFQGLSPGVFTLTSELTDVFVPTKAFVYWTVRDAQGESKGMAFDLLPALTKAAKEGDLDAFPRFAADDFEAHTGGRMPLAIGEVVHVQSSAANTIDFGGALALMANIPYKTSVEDSIAVIAIVVDPVSNYVPGSGAVMFTNTVAKGGIRTLMRNAQYGSTVAVVRAGYGMSDLIDSALFNSPLAGLLVGKDGDYSDSIDNLSGWQTHFTFMQLVGEENRRP